MPIVQNHGITVDTFIEYLTNMSKAGHGGLFVMLEAEKGMIAPIARGDIGIASDRSRVLVLRRAERLELNGENHNG